MWMSTLCNSRDLPFAWKAVNGVPWSCVAGDTQCHFPSFMCFTHANLCESVTMSSEILFFQSLLFLCNIVIATVILTILSVDFVFLYLARHFMDQYYCIWIWTHKKFLIYHHLYKTEDVICDFWAFYDFLNLHLHRRIRLGCVLFVLLEV